MPQTFFVAFGIVRAVAARMMGLVGAGGLFFSASELRAQVIVNHVGSVDPATEGWTRTLPTSGSVGAVTNDLGLGIAAWSVTDNSTTYANYYSFVPSGALIAQGTAQGWTFSATMRLTTSAPSAGLLGFGYQTGSMVWTLYPEQVNGSNDFVVRFYGAGAPSYTLAGQGNDYHTINLVYDPVSATADVFIDGVERISNFSGTTNNSGAQQFFGGGSSGDMGAANYSAVQFSVVPEPAVTAALLGTAALAGVALARRRRP